jgi:hypothetical protein
MEEGMDDLKKENGVGSPTIDPKLSQKKTKKTQNKL